MQTLSQPEVAPSAVPPQIAIVQMASGNWIAQMVYTAAKLGIADLLKAEAKTCPELATATKSNPDALYRLLRSLASVGVFAETEAGTFTLTPLAACLQSDVPGSMRAFVIMLGEEHYEAWRHLLHSVQTGESAFNHLYGMNIFEYYANHAESARIFDQAMTSFSTVENAAVVAGYDFSNINTLVDVAGGHGTLLRDILEANRHLQGILFDQPDVIESAKEANVLSDRIQLVGGSFFESVPVGGDAYLLKHIVHDWDNERSVSILKQCHQAMSDHGKLLIVEYVIPEGNEPFNGKLLDVNMLVMCPGGRERTAAEFKNLFEKAGFKLTRIIPTAGDISIVEGVKA